MSRMGLYEGGAVCLLHDSCGAVYCVQVLVYDAESRRGAHSTAYNNINSICGWLRGQVDYESLFAGFDGLRMNASRLLIGLPTPDTMDVDARGVSDAMFGRVVELNAQSGVPLPREVFRIAFRHYMRKYVKSFDYVGAPRSECGGCGVEAKTKWCSGCRVYRYCGKECQLAHHPTHRATCRAIQRHRNTERAYGCGM